MDCDLHGEGEVEVRDEQKKQQQKEKEKEKEKQKKEGRRRRRARVCVCNRSQKCAVTHRLIFSSLPIPEQHSHPMLEGVSNRRNISAFTQCKS